MANEISDTLNMTPLDEAIEGEYTEVDTIDEDDKNLPVAYEDSFDLDQDIEYVKANLKDVITQGKDSLEEILNLAKQSESPRAYEVVSGAMKALLDANKDYMAAMDKQKEYKEESGQKGPSNVTNNNTIVMTSNDMLERVLKKNEET